MKERLVNSKLVTLLSVFVVLFPFIISLFDGATVIAKTIDDAAKSEAVVLYDNDYGKATINYQEGDQPDELDWTVDIQKKATTLENQVGFSLKSEGQTVTPKSVATTPKERFVSDDDSKALLEAISSKAEEAIQLTFKTENVTKLAVTPIINERQLDGTVKNLLKDQKPITIEVETKDTSEEADGSSTTRPTKPSSSPSKDKQPAQSTVPTTPADSGSGNDQQQQKQNKMPAPQADAPAPRAGRDITDEFSDDNPFFDDTSKIQYFTNDGKTELDPNAGPIPGDALVKMNLHWSVPDDLDLQEGDFYQFKLPDAIKYAPQQGKMGDYASYTIDAEGKVTITFNKNVENASDVEGDLNYSQYLKEELVPGKVVIDVPNSGKIPGAEVQIKTINGSAIEKSGNYDKTPNPDYVTWNVDVNRSMDIMTNAVVTDAFPKEVAFDKADDTVDVYPLAVNLKGDQATPDTDHPLKRAANDDPADAGADYWVDDNGTVHFINALADKNQNAYRIVYKTKIKEKPSPTGAVNWKNNQELKLTNTAGLTTDEQPKERTAKTTVTTQFRPGLDKGAPAYSTSAGKQNYTWTIKYNYRQDNLPANAYVQDTLGPDQIYVGEPTVVPITFTQKGTDPTQFNDVVGTPLVPGQDYDYTTGTDPVTGKPTFKIVFKNENQGQAYRITYQSHYTKVVDDNTDVSEQLTNNVETDEGYTDHGQGKPYNDGIIKNIAWDVRDYNNRMVKWTVDLNNSRYTMDNLVFTDNLSKGFKLYTPDPDETNTTLKNRVLTVTDMDMTPQKKLTLGKDYTIEDKPTGDGFIIKLMGDYESTKHKINIAYWAKFDTSVFDPSEALDQKKFYNQGQADWETDTGKHTSTTDNKPFDPIPPFKENGQKNGSYDSLSKEITWTTAVNYNQQTLKNAAITDPLEGDQYYLPGSAKLYKVTIQKDGTYAPAQPGEADEVPADEFTLTASDGSTAGGTVKVTLPETSDAYVLVFKTTLKGTVIEADYDNVSTFDNYDGDTKVSHDLPARVSVKNGGNHMEKTGVQDKSNNNLVKWQLIINKAQSTFNEFEFTDNPSPNQVIDEDSIRIIGAKVDADSNVTADPSVVLKKGEDYDLVVTTDPLTGKQEMKVTFIPQGPDKIAIDQPYFMQYTSAINTSKATDTLSNDVSFSGTGKTIVDGEVHQDTPVVVSGGDSSGKSGSVLLRKVGPNGEVLAGARLILWRLDSNKKLFLPYRIGVTDENGEVKFGNLRLGDYRVTENVAPPGYNITGKLLYTDRDSGVAIPTVKADKTAEGDFPVTEISNEKTKVILKKTDGDGSTTDKLLAGAEYKLERKAGTGENDWEDLSSQYPDLKTDADGELVIEGLQDGTYRLTETKAPAGYILDASPMQFTVAATDRGYTPIITINQLNYQGSVQLIKENEANAKLPNAVFELQDGNGNKISGGHTTDGDGVLLIKELAPGDYQLVETKAPEGYVINTTPIKFTIADTNNSQNMPVMESQPGDEYNENWLAKGKGAMPPVVPGDSPFINYKGSAKLIKSNGKTGTDRKLLAGAQFNVLDSQKQPLTNGTDPIVLTTNDEGEAEIDNLAPGTYYFKEIKAPENYLMKREPVEFVIEASAEGKPAVVTTEVANHLGKVTFIKQISDAAVEGGVAPAAGAKFGIWKGDQDPKNDPAYKEDISEDDGVIEFDDLETGSYYLMEIDPPPGYQKYPYQIPFEVNENMANAEGVIDFGSLLNFKGKIDMKKIAQGSDSIEGAVFELAEMEEDGTVKGTPEEITVKADGVIFENLAPGKYRLTEIDPAPGYIANPTPIYFDIPDDTSDPVEFSMNNYQSEIEGQKVDGTDGLPNAEYSIYQDDGDGKPTGDAIEVYTNPFDPNDSPASNAKNSKIKTGTDGKFYARGLPVGKYILKEETPPTGYILDTTYHTFEIEAVNEEVNVKPDIIDLGIFQNYQGKAQFKKTSDAPGGALAGADFDLYKQVGSEPNEDDDTRDPRGPFTSGTDGLVEVDKLAPGDYYFKEVTAPTGYKVNPERVKFTIDAENEGEPEVVEANDSKDYVNEINRGKIRITKTGEDYDQDGRMFTKNLAGAEFTLTDEKGVATVVTTGADGTAEFEILANKTYSLKETKAPTGYDLEPTEQSGITLANDGQLITYDYVNKRILTEVKANKEWELHGNMPELFQPEKITLILKQDGAEYRKQEIDAATYDWEYEFTHLPKINAETGEEYDYTVEEEIPNGFVPKIEGTQEHGYQITNNLDFTEINGKKTWDNHGFADRLNPDKVQIQLYYATQGNAAEPFMRDNAVVIADVTRADDFAYSFKELPTYDKDGYKITYSVQEVDVPTGYTGRMVSKEEYKNTIELTQVELNKQWLGDQDDFYGTRPNFLNFELMVNMGTADAPDWQPFATVYEAPADEEAETARVYNMTPDNNGDWKVVATDLPKYEKEVAIQYGFKELNSGKTYTVDDNADVTPAPVSEGKAEITNSLETKKITITKKWDDQSNKFGTRPKQITVQLKSYLQGQEVRAAAPFSTKDGNDEHPEGIYTIDAPAGETDSWSLEIDHLPAFDRSGYERFYTVEEVDPEKDYAAVNPEDGSLEITNVLQVRDVEIKKNWIETAATQFSRPEIQLQLMQAVQDQNTGEVGEAKPMTDEKGTDYTRVIPAVDRGGAKEATFSVQWTKRAIPTSTRSRKPWLAPITARRQKELRPLTH